jgi:hypothetical protein
VSDPIQKTCPSCHGNKSSGFVFVRGEPRHPICALCRGSGVVFETVARWYIDGQEARNARVERGESLASDAARLGITPKAMNAMEHGRCDPSPIL